MKSLISIALALASAASLSQDIKGIRIGMTRADVDELFTWKAFENFTVAEVGSKYREGPILKYDMDGKLEHFMFVFNSDNFDAVKSAFAQKYPKMKCNSSKVGNAMGAKFAQVNCEYKDLSLTRFLNDIDTSVVSLSNNAALEKKRDSATKKAAGDT